MVHGAEGTQLQVRRRMGGWHSEWVREESLESGLGVL